MENKQELEFENWFDIALDVFNRSNFQHLPLNRDAAEEGYNEGLSPEEYIQEMIDSWDSNDD